jgi:hypothetical protein
LLQGRGLCDLIAPLAVDLQEPGARSTNNLCRETDKTHRERERERETDREMSEDEKEEER